MGYNISIQIVDSTGNVIGGLVSTVSANYTQTVRVVDSTNHVLDQLGAIYSKTTTLTAAQIRALDLTAITLVSAAGANMAIIPTQIVIKSTFVSVAYAIGGAGVVPGLDIGYPSHLDYALSLLDSATTLLGASTAKLLIANGQGATNIGIMYNPTVAPTTLANQPLQIGNTASISYNSGPITGSSIAAAGSGYAVNDTGTIDLNAVMNDSNDATYKVLTVNGSGAVLTYQITAAGTVYQKTTANVTSGPYPTVNGGAQAGTGSGFTLNVTSVTAGDGTLKIAVNYSIVDVS